MSAAATRSDVFNREFLEIRAAILQLAAALDRIDRAAGSVPDDARLRQVRHALELLLTDEDGRAEQVELAFSRPYDEAWRQNLGVRPK
jgi:hypothetical protein